ncbi:MAG TPA: universal stress protein [Chloroflexota bacterium]|jgi:nucleotide-binding universal stress UspA family protein
MTLQQILVPLDTSDGAEAALPIARVLAASTNAVLNLVAVSADVEPGGTRDLCAYLDDVAALERVFGFEVRTILRMGDPGEAILMLERELDIDLIVMATHGRSGLGRVLLGSVADQVTQASKAPVVLLRPGERSTDRLRTILVPIDGTPGGALALSVAVPLARTSDSRIVLLHASLSDPRAAETYANRVAAQLLRAGLHAEGRGWLGLPETSIVASADEIDADLIVMSTHGRRGPLRAILGSVADEVVRKCQRPVLLVPRVLHGSNPFTRR